MVYIKPGTFTMGAPNGAGYRECLKFRKDCDESWFSDEKSDEVFVKGFYIDKYEVTQLDFLSVMEFNPSDHKGESLPVDSIIWDEAVRYCENVGKRLPTEREWEKAAHGSTSTTYYWGDELGPFANFCDFRCKEPRKKLYSRNIRVDDGFEKTSPVGSYPPNNFGIYDMAGNVWEWVADDYSNQFSRIKIQGPSPNRSRGIRGGSWGNTVIGLRPSFRDWANSTGRNSTYGFRCAVD